MKSFVSAICTAALVAVPIASPALSQESEVSANPTTNQTAEQSALELRAEQVVAIVNGELEPEEIFTQGFLSAVPPAQLEALSQQLTSQFGAALEVESLATPFGTRSSLSIRMERAIARGGIAIDPSDGNRISELLFQTFEPIGDSPAKIEADLAALPGDIGYLFGPLDGSPPVLASEWGDHMAIGSTFKLYVLAALAREIAEGTRGWDDVVTLGPLRSYPSGMMQDWPQDAQVTLETLASLMISRSDNTATDALIEVLGKQAILETMTQSRHSNPALNTPFLTTREMFLLKGGPDERLEAYRAGDSAAQAQILAAIEDTSVPTAQIQAAFTNGPKAIDVEWFASASDLANLFAFMRAEADPKAFEIMAINTSATPTAEANWSYIGYKGGSEPGVLNLTWLLSDEQGRDHALVLSWNNPEDDLDQTALELIAQRILSLPR